MKNEEHATPIDLEKFTGSISMFAYELIRDSLLPNILGKETNEILYWAGKELARKYPVADFEDLTLFFKKACFGDLVLTKEKKHQKLFTLTGPTVAARIQHGNPSFSLEAGFLAEQMQAQQELYAEAISEINPKAQKVTITLQWDAKDAVSIEQSLETVVLSDTYLSNEELEADYQEEDYSFTEPEVETVTIADSQQQTEANTAFPNFDDTFSFNELPPFTEVETLQEETSSESLQLEEVGFDATSNDVDNNSAVNEASDLEAEIDSPMTATEPTLEEILSSAENAESEEFKEGLIEIKEQEDGKEMDVFINLSDPLVPPTPPLPPVAPPTMEEEPSIEETKAGSEEIEIQEPTIDYAETINLEHLTAEEALHEFDALSQVFSDISLETAPEEEEEESIFDSLPSRSSRHTKKKKK